MDMDMRCRLLVAVAMLAASPLEAGEQLSMRVSPTVAFEPATVVITTIAERDAHNREMEVVAESEGFYRSSRVPLEGEHAARTATFEFRDLPGGQYEVRTILLDSDGKVRASVARDLQVLSAR